MNAAAVESLYREHGHSVLRRARRLLGNEDDARDVLQEIFHSMLRATADFRGDSSVTTWLYSAATNACLNRLRNHKRREGLLETQTPDREMAMGDAESVVIVRDLLARVPRDLAEIAILYYVDEMTHKEIAAVLGCSRRHVGDLVAQLHAILRDVEKMP